MLSLPGGVFANTTYFNPAWVSNQMLSNDITYPFPNLSGCAVEVWEWMRNFIPHFIVGVFIFPCWD